MAIAMHLASGQFAAWEIAIPNVANARSSLGYEYGYIAEGAFVGQCQVIARSPTAVAESPLEIAGSPL